MKVLLTGGTGMLGRNVRDVAREAGIQLVAPPRADMQLLSRSAVTEALRHHMPDVVLHCAGHVGGIQANIADPVSFLVDNTLMGLNVVLGARDVGIPSLLNVGSSCMYPRDRDEPLVEDDLLTGPLEPTNEGYALGKITTAKLCEYISRTDSRYCYRTAIPCNLYGLYDHFDPLRSHLVPAVIRKVHEARATDAPSISIWGDGTARREFMFARDAASILLAMAQRTDELPPYVNVGLGRDFQVLEYYRCAAEVIGWAGTWSFDLGKPTGMKRKLVDIRRQQALGLGPVTSLRDGIAQTYEYFKSIHQHEHH